MRTFFDEIALSTEKGFEMVDITGQVKKSVKSSGIRNGFVVVFSQHVTSAIRINENEVGLRKDFEAFFEKLAPVKFDYNHNKTTVDDRPNGHAHLQSMIMNSSETVPLRNGEMMLGRWQSIFFVELDGARPARKVTIEVVGE